MQRCVITNTRHGVIRRSAKLEGKRKKSGVSRALINNGKPRGIGMECFPNPKLKQRQRIKNRLRAPNGRASFTRNITTSQNNFVSLSLYHGYFCCFWISPSSFRCQSHCFTFYLLSLFFLLSQMPQILSFRLSSLSQPGIYIYIFISWLNMCVCVCVFAVFCVVNVFISPISEKIVGLLIS